MTANQCGYAALVGRPNVGKSTLLNRLVGQKIAITSRKPQTTRHAILGIKTRVDGQILYVDTPGMHRRGSSALNRLLNSAAQTTLRDVDVILFVVQALSWTHEDEAVLTAIKNVHRPVILVVNKVDSVQPRELLLGYLEKTSQEYDFRAIVPVSARRGDNLDRLENEVIGLLPPGENFFPEDQVTDRSQRFLAAELLREQLTRRYARELPYVVSVEIESFQADKDIFRIRAVIWVERAGQKAILVGKDGAALKETASQARREMEKMFGRKVWLDVWVKIKKSWSSDETALARFGYRE